MLVGLTLPILVPVTLFLFMSFQPSQLLYEQNQDILNSVTVFLYEKQEVYVPKIKQKKQSLLKNYNTPPETNKSNTI